jgi:ABC-2 type transport system ATP-binding protein
VLKVRNISRRFGTTFAMKDVTFDVPQGEIMGLIGPNGAGKTTLLEILSGLLPADSGTVLRREGMFYLPEAVTAYPERRAGEVLCLFANLFGRQHALEPAIGALSLSAVLPTRFGKLSKGYRKRLLLAIGARSSAASRHRRAFRWPGSQANPRGDEAASRGGRGRTHASPVHPPAHRCRAAL